MTPYITFRDKDESGELQYYILQRDFPHMIGVLVTYPIKSLSCQPISGYNLFVKFDGCLRGKMLPDYRNIADEIDTIMQTMAVWFYTERIVMDKKRFKKFKIENDATSYNK